MTIVNVPTPAVPKIKIEERIKKAIRTDSTPINP